MKDIKITNFKVFNKKLKSIWNTIENETSVSPFQTYEWNYNWYKNILLNSKNIELNILVFYKNNAGVDIFPFLIEKKNTFKILKFIGGINTDYMAPISSKDSYLKNRYLNNSELKKYFNLNLPKYDLAIFNNQLVEIENNKNFFLNFFKKKEMSESLRIQINKLKFSSYISEFLNKKFINDIYRQIKRLNTKGKLRFIVEYDNIFFKEKINRMIELKYDQYERTGFNMFEDKNFKNIYLDCKYKLNSSNKIHISYLELNNQIIAIHYGFLSKSSLYYIMPAYDIAWKNFSPGNVLLFYLIEYCFKNKLDCFDFTDGYSYYKKRWSNSSYKIFYSYYINSIKGFIFIYSMKLKDRLKKNKYLRKILIILR